MLLLLIFCMSALAPALDRRAQIYWRHVNELVFDGKKADSSRLHTFAAAHFENMMSGGSAEQPVACGQECEVLFPGLRAMPWWSDRVDDFPWVENVERRADVVIEELEKFQVQQAFDGSGGSSGSGNGWSSSVTTLCSDTAGFSKLILQESDQATQCGAHHFPKTLELLKEAQVPLTPRPVAINRQGPSTGLAPHSDNLNFILVCHLGLKVPADGACTFRMHEAADRDECTSVRSWTAGEVLISDTSFVHSTRNGSPSESRFVLHFSIWHPDLSAAEIHGILQLHRALRAYEADVAALDATSCDGSPSGSSGSSPASSESSPASSESSPASSESSPASPESSPASAAVQATAAVLRVRGGGRDGGIGRYDGSGGMSRRCSTKSQGQQAMRGSSIVSEARRVLSDARRKLEHLRSTVRRRLSTRGSVYRLLLFSWLLRQPLESVRLDQWESVRAPIEDPKLNGLRGAIIRRRRRANKVTQVLGVGYTPRIVCLAGLMLRGMVMSTGLPALFDPPLGLGIGSCVAARFTSREWLACMMIGWFLSGPYWEVLDVSAPPGFGGVPVRVRNVRV